jgi:hypothetical protein
MRRVGSCLRAPRWNGLVTNKRALSKKASEDVDLSFVFNPQKINLEEFEDRMVNVRIFALRLHGY